MSESRRPVRSRSAAAETVDLAEAVSTLERHRWLALALALAVIAGGMAWAATRPPLYKTTATLKLEQESKGSGVLNDLAALTSAPAAEGEMSILRSRAMVEATVAASAQWHARGAAFTGTDADDFRMDGAVELGLVTRVESQERLPVNDLWRVFGLGRARGERLFARCEPLTAGAPRRVRVVFPSSAGGARVRLSIPTRSGFPDRDEQEFDYAPGVPIEYLGARFVFEAVGDFAGAAYFVEHRSLKETVDEYLAKLDVEETSRNSGVIRLTVTDTDPDRGAEFANALCHNYLLRSIRLGRSRATRTIEFIDHQLAEQKRLLDEAEREVVALQQRNPAVILVSASAESMLGRLAAQETERTRIALARVALAEAAEMLDRGETEALARLSRELPDLVSLSYIDAIGRLGSEALALERSDASPTKSILQKRLDDLALEEREATQRLTALESAITALSAGDSAAISRLFAESPGLALLDPTTAQYVADAARVDAQISALAGDVTPAHPSWSQLDATRKDLEAKIGARLTSVAAGLRLAAEDRTALARTYREAYEAWPVTERARVESATRELTARVSHNLHARLASLASEESALAREISGLEAELAALPESERAVAEPLRRREAHTQVVKLLLDSQQQAQLSAAATLPSAILIDPAIPPDGRHSPRLFFDFLLCCVAGLALGVVAAFVRQSLSGAIYTQAEVEEASNLPVFGSIPDFRHGPLRVRRQRAPFLALRDDPDGPVSEAYRSVRQSLRFARPGEEPVRTLAFTSCAPGEGKTTTNINIAMAFASAEHRVLLVDADMRKPTLHSAFDAPIAPGLAEVLEARTTWRDCVRASGQPGLDLLCAGVPRTSPSELLRSASVAERIAEWTAAYDLVVFDLPPALAVADAEILANELDAVVLLYRSGGVHREAFATMARKLSRAGANVIGAVVNAVQPTHGGAASYYGGYHEGYGRSPARKRGLKQAS